MQGLLSLFLLFAVPKLVFAYYELTTEEIKKLVKNVSSSKDPTERSQAMCDIRKELEKDLREKNNITPFYKFKDAELLKMLKEYFSNNGPNSSKNNNESEDQQISMAKNAIKALEAIMKNSSIGSSYGEESAKLLMQWLKNRTTDAELVKLAIDFVKNMASSTSAASAVRKSFNDLLILTEARSRNTEIFKSAVDAACQLGNTGAYDQLYLENAKISHIQTLIEFCADKMQFCNIMKSVNAKASNKILLAFKTSLLDVTRNYELLANQLEECRAIIENSDVKGSEQILSLLQKRDEIWRHYSMDHRTLVVPRFSDLAKSKAQEDLKETIQHALLYPHRFNVAPSSAILLYGAPGTGKATLAAAAAFESGAALFHISASVINAKDDKDAVDFIKMLFLMAINAEPSAIIFIDEIDALLGHGITSRAKSEFLAQMRANDSHQHHRVLVLGATIQPWEMDKNALQRFDKRIFVKMPNIMARKEMFEKLAQENAMTIVLNDENKMTEFASWTNNYSFSDLRAIGKNAILNTLHKEKEEKAKGAKDATTPFTLANLKMAFENYRPLTSMETIKQLEEVAKNRAEGTNVQQQLVKSVRQ